MYNRFFQNAGIEEKKTKFRCILLNKAPCITDEHIDQIFDFIDFREQYYLKVFFKIQKFKNTITNEYVRKDSNYVLISNSQKIYGNFFPGYYIQSEHIINQAPSIVLDNDPCAAIKVVKEKKPTSIKTSRYLILYFPHKTLFS